MQHHLPTLLEDFRDDDNIFNIDESGLYFRAMPDGSLCYTNTTPQKKNPKTQRKTSAVKKRPWIESQSCALQTCQAVTN